MSIQELGHLPITALPDFDIQPGKPSNECISIKLPRTNLDQQDLIDQWRVAINQGETLTVEGSYLWDLALLLEGCTSEHEYRADWDNHNHDVVRLSKSLIYILRHLLGVKFYSEGFVSLPHLTTMQKSVG
jgi:hypothetical protein